MKFALPSRENQIDDHFGHCKHFTIFTLNRASEIVAEEKLQPGDGSWYESNVASQLAAMGVETMLAGNIGAGTINVLEAHGIRVVRGCSGGDFRRVVQVWLEGSTSDSAQSCSHHG